MTTSYKKEAIAKLRAEKKLMRQQEAIEQKAKRVAEEKAHQANMARIEKKMAIINGETVVEEKPVKKKVKKTPAKKTTTKKPAAKKRGRPKKS
tara:strand:- start:114 stop:392 length:279 start_codon:yes stop_codon:yes gene_type:complete